MPASPPSIFVPAGAGTPAAPPAVFHGRPDIPDDGAWHLVTTLGGNRDIHWKWTGPEQISIVYQVPAGDNPTPFDADYAAGLLTISLPLTGSPGSAAPSMTANGLIAASISGLPPAGTLTRTLASGSDGSGILGALAETPLQNLTPPEPPAIFAPAGGGAAGDPPEIFAPDGAGSAGSPPGIFVPADGSGLGKPPGIFFPSGIPATALRFSTGDPVQWSNKSYVEISS